MELQRFGRIVRALRLRRRWRQIDLAHAAGVSQSLISRLERGHAESVTVETLGRILSALDARLALDVRWRGALADRLLDERHAALSGDVARTLRALGWTVDPEVTYSHFGERGSIDLLGRHPGGGLLIIEIKTELVSVEQMLRKLDEKVRLAPILFGPIVGPVGRVVVLRDDSTQRDRVARQASILGSALPDRSVAVKRWLRVPVGPLRGLWFLRDMSPPTPLQRTPAPARPERGSPRLRSGQWARSGSH